MRSKMDLQHASQHFRLLSDSTRLRLLMLVDRNELSVAELSAITQLAVHRISVSASPDGGPNNSCDRLESLRSAVSDSSPTNSTGSV